MVQWNRNLVRHTLISLMTFVMLSACTLPFLSGQDDEDFADYVEKVFILQNSMTSQIMALSDSEDKPKNVDELLQAEQQMQKQCEALNEYAVRDSEGLSTGLALKNKVAQTAKDCEIAAKKVQKMLKH